MALICIEEGGFRIEQSTPDSIDFWDLSQLVKVKHKDGTEGTDWKIRAYGISLGLCIHTIIGIRVRMKHSESIKTLKDFLGAYKEEKKEVFRYFKLDCDSIKFDDKFRKTE